MPGGRPKKYDSDEQRKAADAERKRRIREALVDPSLPERDIEEDPEPVLPAGARNLATLLALDPFAPLSSAEEQLIRDHFGYTESERRTRAEREIAAAKMKEFLGPPTPEVQAVIAQLADAERRHLAKTKAYRESLGRP